MTNKENKDLTLNCKTDLDNCKSSTSASLDGSINITTLDNLEKYCEEFEKLNLNNIFGA